MILIVTLKLSKQSVHIALKIFQAVMSDKVKRKVCLLAQFPHPIILQK